MGDIVRESRGENITAMEHDYSDFKGKGNSKYTPELIERTRKLWSIEYKRELTDAEAEENLENLVGFFTCLHDLDVKYKSKK